MKGSENQACYNCILFCLVQYMLVMCVFHVNNSLFALIDRYFTALRLMQVPAIYYTCSLEFLLTVCGDKVPLWAVGTADEPVAVLWVWCSRLISVEGSINGWMTHCCT